jgi:hypothetical protein
MKKKLPFFGGEYNNALYQLFVCTLDIQRHVQEQLENRKKTS